MGSNDASTLTIQYFRRGQKNAQRRVAGTEEGRESHEDDEDIPGIVSGPFKSTR